MQSKHSYKYFPICERLVRMRGKCEFFIHWNLVVIIKGKIKENKKRNNYYFDILLFLISKVYYYEIVILRTF